MKNLIQLFPFALKYKLNIITGVVAMLLQVAAGFVLPYLMITIIDDAIPNMDLDLLWVTTLQMIGVAVVGLLAGLLNNYNSQYVSQYASADLRLKLFTKIQNLSFHNIDNFKTSRLITTSTNDIVRIQRFFQLLLRIVVRAPLMIGMGIFLAIETSPELSTIFYFSMPILIISIIIIMIIAFPRFQKVQKTVDGLNKATLETVNAPRVIKSFTSVPYERARFKEANELFRKTNTSAEKVMAFAEPIIMFIFNATLAGVIFLGVYFINQGSLINPGTNLPEVGKLIAFNSYSMQILFGLMMFAMMMIFISRAEVSAKRIMEVLDEQIDLTNKDNAKPIPTMKGKIEFENVSFSYGASDHCVIRDLNFTIEAGQRIGIIGSTGSGKSTLIQLIPRLYDVIRGSVKIDGVDVRELDLYQLRSHIGFVTQTPTIFSGSIGTNIMQGTNVIDYDVFIKAAKHAAAYEYIEQYDDKFNHQIQQRGSNLSGGQKQRLSLTRAFIRDPKILILDDATSAVDAKSEERILNEIEQLSHKMTSIIISQKISTIKNLDKILVLNNKGEIDGYDTHKSLLQTSQVYQEIAKSQVGDGGANNE